VSVLTSLIQAAVTQGSSKSPSAPQQNTTYSTILPDAAIGIAVVIVAGLGIAVFKRGSKKFRNGKNPFNR
jgi:hypothetical protein